MLFSVSRVFRLCRRHHIPNKRYNHARATSGASDGDGDGGKETNATQPKDFRKLYEKHKHQITFNSHLEQDKLKLGYFKYYKRTVEEAQQEVKKDYEQRSLPPLPLALQYCVDQERLLNEDTKDEYVPEPEKPFQLPLAGITVEVNEKEVTKASPKQKKEFDRSNIDKWMTNYEYFDDTKLEDSDDEVDYEWSRQYGTPDPEAHVSQVPCGGCGALLHCSDPAIPGYLPSEIFKNRSNEELKSLECQRCHFLKEYNIALDVSVQPEEYEKLLEAIRHVKSLVVLMVDLLDFPCSIWPGIVDIIGPKRPIIVVGNKVDLLPGDSIGYLKRVRQSLINEIKKTQLGEANIKHVALISAKTGFGVESLISAMFKIWLAKGDVFLVGTTNVGKSSLFNALLQSDYCKVQAVDIIKRATVSRWPGTTLNLLKFPINRPSGWKIYQRTQRLKADSRLMKIEKQIRQAHIEAQTYGTTPNLIGHIGRSFSDPSMDEATDPAGAERRRRVMLDERDEVFAASKWLYDTPGVVLPAQLLAALTTDELLRAVPRRLLRPQTYYLRPGQTLLLGGLARLDLLACPEPARFTLFCSDRLPVTVTDTADADEVYEAFVGTELLGAPLGGPERLRNWPGLQRYEKELEFVGEGPKVCCADIVLSSVGWAGVTAKQGSACRVAAHTPGARGVHVRRPALLPAAINLKGRRLRDTPAYRFGKLFIDDNYIEKQKRLEWKNSGSSNEDLM